MTDSRPPLLLVATTDDGERLRGGLTLACAEAALGGSVRLFLQLDAVALLRPPLSAPRDAAHAAHGLPTLAVLLDDALELGVALVACQSGLALAGLDASLLDSRIAPGGPVGVLAATGAGERLVIL
ncbi:peroxiredoxin [Sphingobium sufflavum]|uniref:peroxiredoxin n=1 Tax=Sphingobium sufflavum TaxID=1129547 RepID=UPI001F361579|nr:peroxiredoxin [Sphingobium sufflavum]MCE7795753.1 peroxiredoxin [Sphingobium sufflavum]